MEKVLLTKEKAETILEKMISNQARIDYINEIRKDEEIDSETLAIWEDAFVVVALKDYRENVFTPEYGYYGAEIQDDEQEEKEETEEIEETEVSFKSGPKH